MMRLSDMTDAREGALPMELREPLWQLREHTHKAALLGHLDTIEAYIKRSQSHADDMVNAALERVKRGTDRVCFYENEFYVLSNFSAFNLVWSGITFSTSEAAYHWEKFKSEDGLSIRNRIMNAPSAHEAFKIAEANKVDRRTDWDEVKVDIMREILRAKAQQHEYVQRKLMETGDRELIEDSWRDDFWGWGPNRDGQNMLGKLWMEIRAEYRALKKDTP